MTNNGKTPKPVAVLHGKHGEVAHDDFHLHGWKTTCDEDGRVIRAAEIVAKGWHFCAFIERADGDGGDGIWLMFPHDVTFRAGEGVWLTPATFMRQPRIEIRG